MEELIQLTKENNALLKEIIAYIRIQQSTQHKNEEEMKNLLTNIVANLLINKRL